MILRKHVLCFGYFSLLLLLVILCIGQRLSILRWYTTEWDNTETKQGYPDTKILCMILTNGRNHATKARAVNRTWAQRCDRHVFSSDKKDSSLPVIDVFALTRTYDISERLSRSLEEIHRRHMQNFDWLFVADDDTYVIVENLRHFLIDKDPRKQHYLGFPFNMTKFRFNHGGSGYVLSKHTLDVYVTNGLNGKTRYESCRRGGFYAHADINVAGCLWMLGIKPQASHDEHQRERFMKENPIKLLNDIREGELLLYKYRDIINKPLRKYEALSEDAISFHYMSPGDMYFVDFTIYNLRIGGRQSRNRIGYP